MNPGRCAVLVLALSGATLAAPRPASAEPNTRTGFFAGFGLGSSNVSWDWNDGGRRSEWSGSGSLRAGKALANHLAIGLEAWAWAKDYEISTSVAPVPVETRLSAGMVSAAYFPGGGGFFLRGGVGLALGRVDLSPPAGVTFPGSGQTSDTGPALLGSMGYEVRLTSTFALGAAGEALYLGVEGDALASVFAYGLDVQFNWYW
jgi:hypothetical protein